MTAMTTAAATRPATCDLPPDAATTALRGGLALTGNEPISPAATLAAPIPTRSGSRASAALAPLLRERQVAALWTRHRNATVKAGIASLVTCATGADGRPIDGSPPETGPSSRTPWSCRCRVDAAAMAMTATRCWYCGVPAAATVTTPAATTGAIVESAPTDIWRLAPKMVIISDPTTNA